MKHFFSPSRQLYAYESDGSQDHLIPNDYTPATDEEVYAIQNPQPTEQERIEEFNRIVQGYLDAFAISWKYNSMLSAVSYIFSSDPKYKAEAQALINWRDQVWSNWYTTLSLIETGKLPMPEGKEGVIATLLPPPSPITV